jgi:hypothetical protein
VPTFDIDQYPVDLQGKILRKLLDQAEADISSKAAELIHQQADHEAAMGRALKEASDSSDAALAAALATARNEGMEKVAAIQAKLDATSQELTKRLKHLEEAHSKYTELEESIESQVKTGIKGKLEEFRIEKIELQAANVAVTEERKKFKDLFEALQSNSEHEIEGLKARIEKTNERYLELKKWKEKAIGDGLMDAVVELNHERFQYAGIHEDLLKTVDRLLKLVPSIDGIQKSKRKQGGGGPALNSEYQKAVDHYKASAEENHTEATRLFELYRDASHAPLPKDDGIKTLMKSDSVMMTLLSQAVVEYSMNLRSHLGIEVAERKREVDAMTRHCIGMKHETEELVVAYESEETAEVIRNLRNIIREQNIAIQYHVMMYEKTELEGKHPVQIGADNGVALLKKALEPSQEAMSPAKPAVDVPEEPSPLALSRGVLEELEDFVTDEDMLKKVALRIEEDAKGPGTPSEDDLAIRQEAVHLERERANELTHELFRRVDDMFVRIDNSVRRVFIDSNYRGMLEWGRAAEKKAAAAKLAMEKGGALVPSSLNYRSPVKPGQTLKSISRRGLSTLGMESAKKSMGKNFALPQPVTSISKASSKSAARLNGVRKTGHLEDREKQTTSIRVPPEMPIERKPIYELKSSDPAQSGVSTTAPLGPRMMAPRHGAAKRLGNRNRLANQQEFHLQRASPSARSAGPLRPS